METDDDEGYAVKPKPTSTLGNCECGDSLPNMMITAGKVSPMVVKFTATHRRSSSLPADGTGVPKLGCAERGLSLDSREKSVNLQITQSETKSYQYGWWCFTPLCLQRILNNAKAFIILVTLANVLQGVIVNGLLKVNVTSLERRYKFLSSESGLIISSYDIAGCLCLLPMSYIGGRGHKPRWISIGVLMMGLGSFILALPRFLAGRYEYTPSFTDNEVDQPGLCQPDIESFPNATDHSPNSGSCDSSQLIPDTYLKQMKYVFMLGQFFNGIGNTPMGVLAVTFVDESVDKRVYPIYIGIYYLGALLGPAFGFVLGARFLTTFTNLGETPEDITPESPKWVGAWWIGFIIAGTLTILLSIPLFGYPRKLGRFSKKAKGSGGCCYTTWWRSNRSRTGDVARLETSRNYTPKNDSEPSFRFDVEEVEARPMMTSSHMDSNIQIEPARTCGVLLRNFLRDIVAVISNRAFLFLSLTAAIYSTVVSGFSTFGPKFIESQLGKSAADAANLFGYVCIPAGAGGMLIGAFLMTGLKMNHKNALQMCIAVSLCGLLAHFVLVLNCEDFDLAGVTVPYNFDNVRASKISYDSLNMTSSCNFDCACDARMQFNPVCDGNNILYYSPCHAGCSVVDAAAGKTFKNCSCIAGAEPELKSVKAGLCSKPCQWQTLLLFSLFVVILTTFVCTVPGVDLSLRCFPYHQRSLAVGIQWVLIRTLGSIPGPIIFGAMIDGSCLLWGKAACNAEKGPCLLYKNSNLSTSFLVISVIYKAAGIVTLSLALLCIVRDAKDSFTDESLRSTNTATKLQASTAQSSSEQSTSGLQSQSAVFQ